MRYLVHKSMSIGYLTHFERLSILYVFGHLGDEGQEFVQTVMSFTINYNHTTTSHFIETIRENPISKTLNEEKRNEMYEELNCVNKAQELSEKLVGLKKQKRGIEKAIQKIEKELAIVYDNANVDCMEIDAGILIRKKVWDRYEWHIEI